MLGEIKKFVTKSIRPFNVEEGNARFGLLQYGAKPLKLMDFGGSSKTRMSLLLDTLTQQNEESDPVKALQFIRPSFYGKQTLRQDALKTVVLLINGDKARLNRTEFELTFRSLNDSGINFVLVAIGRSGRMLADLKDRGSRYGFVHLLDTGSQLPRVIPDVVKPGKSNSILQVPLDHSVSCIMTKSIL